MSAERSRRDVRVLKRDRSSAVLFSAIISVFQVCNNNSLLLSIGMNKNVSTRFHLFILYIASSVFFRAPNRSGTLREKIT